MAVEDRSALAGTSAADADSQRATLRDRVVDFLSQEAELADAHRYDEWLELWSPDGLYWVPSNEDDYDPTEHVSIIYDNYSRIQERCFRLSVGGAHSQDPPSRLCRVIGNVQVEPVPEGANEIAVRAKMILIEVRSGIRNVYGVRCEYRLVPENASFKIRMKKVILVENDELLGNLTFLL